MLHSVLCSGKTIFAIFLLLNVIHKRVDLSFGTCLFSDLQKFCFVAYLMDYDFWVVQTCSLPRIMCGIRLILFMTHKIVHVLAVCLSEFH